MSEQPKKSGQAGLLLLVSGLWVLPLIVVLQIVWPGDGLFYWMVAALTLLAAPLPALLRIRSQDRAHRLALDEAEEKTAQFKLRLDEVRFRSARLREELQAADRAAKRTNQLALLGQFTAGFMHEFNNPLAIVEGRIEVLLDERKQDAPLAADLEEMLKETRYMGRIAKTLLQALRRERGGEVYEPTQPERIVNEVAAKLRPKAQSLGVQLEVEAHELPMVDVPEHVLAEVMRGLIQNALNALEGCAGSVIRIWANEYQSAGARVVLHIDDNGPGVPVEIEQHLFEPFVTAGSGREHLGLGLFLAASLLDMYDATISYAQSELGGAGFQLELPPTRFANARHFSWFQGGVIE